MFQSSGSIALNFGPFSIHWYGLLIGVAILLSHAYVMRESHRRGLDSKHFDNMSIWVIASGVLGARLYYILFNIGYYLEHPFEILQIWQGGLAIHGALIGGFLAFIIYVYTKKIPWKTYLDIMLPGVLLAQSIGRWGNFFNNEAFGTPTNLPWKLFIPERFRPESFSDFEYFHPTFLYESLWNLIGFFILAVLASTLYPTSRIAVIREKPHGILICIYLLWYSFGRFFIEILRTDSLYLGSFKIAQIMSIFMFMAGLLGLYYLQRKSKVKL